MTTKNRIKTVLTLAAVAMAIVAMAAATAQAAGSISGMSIYYRADNVDGLGNPGDGSTTTLVNLANPGTHDGTIVNGNGVVQNVGESGAYDYGVVLTGNDSTKSHITTSYQVGGGVNKVTAATWEFWLRADSGPYDDRGALYGEFQSSGDYTRHYLRLNGIGTGTHTAMYDEYPPSGNSALSDSPLFDTGTFVQIVATKSGDTMTFYKNGVQVGAMKTHSETYTGGGIVQTLLGIRSNGNESFVGQFNIIRIYDAVLTPEEVLQNYNSGSDPNAPFVNAGVDMITLSGMGVDLAPVVVNNDTEDPNRPLSYTWSADAPGGYTVEWDPNEFVEAPTVTITQNTPSNPNPVTLTLSVDLVGTTSSASDTITTDVYDDSCLAAKAVGPVEFDQTDIDENCITAFPDFAIMAATWLDDYTLTESIAK